MMALAADHLGPRHRRRIAGSASCASMATGSRSPYSRWSEPHWVSWRLWAALSFVESSLLDIRPLSLSDAESRTRLG
jgi:hypothetical protein